MKSRIRALFEIVFVIALAPILVFLPVAHYCYMAVISEDEWDVKKYRQAALEGVPTVMSLWMVYLMIYILISFIGGR